MDIFNEALPCRWTGCNGFFNNEEILLKHVTESHIGRKSTNNLCLDCHWDGCDVKTTKRDHITSHLKVHIAYKPYKCNHCSKAFKRPQDLKKHEKLHSDNKDNKLNNNNGVAVENNIYNTTNGFLDPYSNSVMYRDISPLSASSDNLISSPQSQNFYFPNQQLCDFVSTVQNKSINPEYNNDMEAMLNNMKFNNMDNFNMDGNLQNNFDINYFNEFMTQLQNNASNGLDLDYLNNLNQHSSSLSPPHLSYDNSYNYNQNEMAMNNTEYFNNNNNMMYPSLDFDTNTTSMDQQQINSMLFAPVQYNTEFNNNQMLNTSQPQFQNYDPNMYTMMNANPLCKEPSQAKELTSEELVDDELDGLISNIKAIDIKKEKKDEENKLNNEESVEEKKEKDVDDKQKRINHVLIIKEIIKKVNAMYEPKVKEEESEESASEPKNEIVKLTSSTAIAAGYPSLDDI